ncbi:MAG: deoxyribodipyrimidine photo-lyase, partial [Nitrosopumilus sp.]
KKKETRLQVLEGNTEKSLEKIIKKHKIEAIFSNKDFSSYAQNRDEKIFQICKRNEIPFHSILDFFLQNYEVVLILLRQ